MLIHNLTPENSLRKEEGKDNHFRNQLAKAFDGLFRHPRTMMELSIATGIDRANLCRYCRLMRRAGTIAVVKRTYCSITKHLANKYTTNPDLFPIQRQLNLFEVKEGDNYE